MTIHKKRAFLLFFSLVLFGAGCTSETSTVSTPQTGESESQEVTEEHASTYGGDEELITADNCIDDECLQFDSLELDTLELDVVDAMERALDDEYKALETYNQVIATFGSVTPFTNIRRAEERHIAALQSLFEKYGYDVPENPYQDDTLISVSSVVEACEVGVQAEVDNAALYENELLPVVTDYEDVTRVFTNLMNASQENHLPAFQRCADGSVSNGYGSGYGQRGNGGM